MAEALGISAAVAQFVDIGLRLCLKLHAFCNEVHEVHVKQQIEVASRIQASILGGSVALGGNSEALLETILKDQRQAMECLLDLINSVTNLPGDGIFRRAWNGIRAIDKKKEMEFVCEQIQAKASLLSSCLANTNL
ncbi:hypothetical protein KVR01_009356 [Diaporthe batatas]|uniref:uncharacterized protein n=1 Tax=Diaporthe batatas TaxID=748121 RepID=UPI001D045A7C|nr:uncharacterized protein KVR01_009356 [Diaporthe batatas]KAG8161092.1 hypothetical protein KVR01_009356 [Diaporthe batatas]